MNLCVPYKVRNTVTERSSQHGVSWLGGDSTSFELICDWCFDGSTFFRDVNVIFHHPKCVSFFKILAISGTNQF
jgi:hypothetical protein